MNVSGWLFSLSFPDDHLSFQTQMAFSWTLQSQRRRTHIKRPIPRLSKCCNYQSARAHMWAILHQSIKEERPSLITLPWLQWSFWHPQRGSNVSFEIRKEREGNCVVYLAWNVFKIYNQRRWHSSFLCRPHNQIISTKFTVLQISGRVVMNLSGLG